MAIRGPHMISRERTKLRAAAQGHQLKPKKEAPDAPAVPGPNSDPGQLTVEEKTRISEAAYRHYASDSSISRESALQRAADELLPLERRRRIVYPNVNHWVVPHWQRLDQETGQSVNEVRRSFRHVQRLKVQQIAEAAPEPQAEPEGVNIDTPPKGVKKKVHWKPDEAEKVALETARLLVEDINGEFTDLQAMRQAQINVLPEDRQRVLSQAKSCQEVLDRATKLMPVVRRNKERKEREEREALEAAERIERERIEREEREKQEREERVKAEAQAEATRLLAEREAERQRIHTEAFNSAVAQAVQKQLDTAPYTAILGALAKKVLGDFMDPLMKGMEERMEAKMLGLFDELTKPTEPAPEAPGNVSEMRPKENLKVVVVGLGNQEYDQLRKDFFADVTFKQVKVETGRHGHTAQAMLEAARGMDAVFAMHHVVGADVKMAAAKLKEMKVPYIAVTGNIRDLRSRIKSAVSGELPFELAA